MTIVLRKSDARGHANHGWLDTYHSFSFSSYYDPKFMGYRDLRVINDDIIEGGAGFPPHEHENMEIVTYMLEGALAHKDSSGGEGVLKRGDVQAMTAGSGVRHSEFNGSKDQPAHLIQIWIMPAKDGLKPAYSQVNLPDEKKRNKLCMIAGPAGEGALSINQDARIYASLLDAGKSISHIVKEARGVWIQMAGGEIEVNGQKMAKGDGAAIEDETEIKMIAQKDSEFLLFDLA